jgi:hypothetical protein
MSQRGWRAVGRMQRIEYVVEECGDAESLAAIGDAQQAERAAFARQLLAVGTFPSAASNKPQASTISGVSMIGRSSPPRSAPNSASAAGGRPHKCTTGRRCWSGSPDSVRCF